MPDYKITVGNAEVLSLTDGADRAPATTLFPNIALSQSGTLTPVWLGMTARSTLTSAVS